MTSEGSGGDRPRVRLFTRAGCHLCDEAAAALAALAGELRFEVEEVDVDAQAELARQYGERVPVIEVGGVVAAEGVVEAGALRARLRDLLTS